MKIIAISDTHCLDLTKLTLPKGDLLIHAGDFTYRGTVAEVTKAMTQLGEVAKNYKYGAVIIAGNHDWLFERDPGLARTLVPKNVKYLNDEEVTIDGFTIWGSPVQPEFCNWAFNRQRGPEIQRHWDMIPTGTDIVITHGPVYGILDNTAMTNGRVGCSNLRATLEERVKPKLHICGHIHEGHGDLTFKETRYINAALLDDNYNLTYEATIIDI